MEFQLTEATLKTFLRKLLPGEGRLVFSGGDTPHTLRVHFADQGDMQRAQAELRALGLASAAQPQGEAMCDFNLPLCHYMQGTLARAVQECGQSARAT